MVAVAFSLGAPSLRFYRFRSSTLGSFLLVLGNKKDSLFKQRLKPFNISGYVPLLRLNLPPAIMWRQLPLPLPWWVQPRRHKRQLLRIRPR